MYSYQYEPAGDDPQHGYIHLYEDGVLIGTNEEWASLTVLGGERFLQRITEQANAREPGRMIPLDDPRLYTHCQWCGEPVDRDAEQKAAWDSGQWHFPKCYKHTIDRRRSAK